MNSKDSTVLKPLAERLPVTRRFAAPRHNRLFAAVLATLATCAASQPHLATQAADPPSDSWLRDDSLRKQLALPASVTWSGRPFRTAIDSLSRSQRVAVWLDRRLDPALELEFTATGVPLQNILNNVATVAGGSLGQVGSVLYFGPTSTASRIMTVARLRTDELENLPSEERDRWLAARPVHWPFLSEPRRLLEELSRQMGCTMVAIDQIPHDLWPAADLPPLTAVEQLTLLLAGFDRTYRVDLAKREIILLPWPERVEWSRTYPSDATLNRVLPELRRRRPEVVTEKQGAKWRVSGLAEDHQLLRSLLAGDAPAAPPGKQEHRYTLTIKNVSLDAVLKRIETTAKLRRVAEAGLASRLAQRVSIDIQDATLEKLLEAAFANTGLRFQVLPGELHITAADEPR